jgi:hypothetical protein
MLASGFARTLRLGVPYLAPTVAAALLLRAVLEAKYHEGWFDAQGCPRDAGCALGNFNYLEWGIVGACAAASFLLVRSGLPRRGNVLAIVIAVLMVMSLVGMNH